MILASSAGMPVAKNLQLVRAGVQFLRPSLVFLIKISSLKRVRLVHCGCTLCPTHPLSIDIGLTPIYLVVLRAPLELMLVATSR